MLKRQIKKRIFVFSDCYIYGGSERLMAFLLKNNILKDNFDVHFAYRKHKNYDRGLTDDYKKLGIEAPIYPIRLLSNSTLFYKINSSKLPGVIKSAIKAPFFLFDAVGIYFIYNVSRLYLAILKIKPDLVHINNGGYPGARTCNQLVLASKLGGIANIVYQVNNIAYPQRGPFDSYYDKLVNKYVRNFITASAKAKDALVTNRRFTTNISQIPNTVVLEEIIQGRDDILNSLNWPENTFLIVQVAFLTARKGQIYLLQALKEIKTVLPTNHSIKLILVGNGEDEFTLKEFTAKSGLTETVWFAGYLPNSADYINACDLFVLPSVSNEDMPLSLLTAMSMGKAIIASKYAGISEALESGKNGILVNPDKHLLSDQITERILQLYKDQKLRTQLGEAARQTFANHYAEEAYGRNICKLYRQTMT